VIRRPKLDCIWARVKGREGADPDEHLEIMGYESEPLEATALYEYFIVWAVRSTTMEKEPWTTDTAI
jgi:hypothetical protein